MTVLYVSLKARTDEGQAVWYRLNRISGSAAVIMGDINARSLRWDTNSNSRGDRLQTWDRTKGWQVRAPKTPSYRCSRRASTPDMFLTKGLSLPEQVTMRNISDTASDHYPVLSSGSVQEEKRGRPELEHIPRIQRRNAQIMGEAEKNYEQMFPQCLAKRTQAERSGSLEGAYKAFRKAILDLWEKTRAKKPQIFRPFWSKALDTLSKQCKKLYRKRLTERYIEA